MFIKLLNIYKMCDQIDAKIALWDWPQGTVLYNFVHNLQVLIINKMFVPYKAF